MFTASLLSFFVPQKELQLCAALSLRHLSENSDLLVDAYLHTIGSEHCSRA
jgi:hypothetical protein